MKKLLVLLLIPLFSFSQTYEDIMGIDSKEKFVRTMVENGYERIEDGDKQLIYAFNPTYNDEGEASSTAFVNHLEFDVGGTVFLTFQVRNFFGEIGDDNQYDKIFAIAKARCEYHSLTSNIYDENDEMVQYKCEWDDDDRTRERRISFSKKDGTGYVSYMYFKD